MSEIKRRGLMLILSAPSGAGKTTLAKMLLKKDKHLHSSISVTTRTKRPGEKDGIDYYYTDVVTFKRMVDSGDFLEYAEVFNNFYGTPKFAVEKHLQEGEDVVFDIEWQGHRQLTSVARQDVASVFILPPSKDELIRRLKNRNQDSPEVLIRRIEQIDTEISHWHEYDYTIINRDLEDSFEKVLAILKAERLKKTRRLGLNKFIADIIQEDIKHAVEEVIEGLDLKGLKDQSIPSKLPSHVLSSQTADSIPPTPNRKSRLATALRANLVRRKNKEKSET